MLLIGLTLEVSFRPSRGTYSSGGSQLCTVNALWAPAALNLSVYPFTMPHGSSGNGFNPYSRIRLLILERKRDRDVHEREREINVRDEHRCDRQILISCLWCVPQLGTEPATFWCMRQRSNLLSHPARAGPAFLFHPVWALFFQILTAL